MSLPTVAPANLGPHAAKITSVEDIESSTRWIKLQVLNWQDEDGKARKWETALRSTRGSAGVDAVAIAAILKHPSRPLTIPIILQYRPPVRAICVELPAGLVDADEGPEISALRELHEEVGYGGPEWEKKIKVISVGDTIVSDPGMSVANMKIVTVEVTLEEGDEPPTPKLEPGEHIEVRPTPLTELHAHLQSYAKLGYLVDARLSHYAEGIELAKKYSLS